MRILKSLVMCVAALALPSQSPAEITPRDAQRFCVDIALLKGGVELRGAVLSRDQKELRMAVQRSWLTAKHPAMAIQFDADAAAKQAAAGDELKTRIGVWKTERAADTRLVAVLNRELERLTQAVEPAAAADSQFVVVTTPADRVRRVFTASASSRQVAMVAWREHFDHVEDTLLKPLKLMVEKRIPDWQATQVDLTDRLPTGEPQTSDEWAARQAVFEYEYRERLDFQGTGNMVLQVGEGAEKPNLAEIFAKTAAEALQDELGGLGLNLGPGSTQKPPGASDWKSTAIELAQRLDRRGFRVTRVPKITGNGPATVTVCFLARLSDGTYRMIWSNETTTDPATITDEALEQLQQDPQVQEILKVANALSLGKDATTAVRFGAAVQASLDESENRFFEFRQRYNDSLDGPPLSVPAP